MKLPGGRKVGALSKGMRTKLALLVGISHQAEMLLLDEPTSGLDVESRQELRAYLKEFAGKLGACLLVSSHLFEDLEEVANSVLIMRGGQVRFKGQLDRLHELPV
jgi:ABC-2 type transport system ATP-binding protein